MLLRHGSSFHSFRPILPARNSGSARTTARLSEVSEACRVETLVRRRLSAAQALRQDREELPGSPAARSEEVGDVGGAEVAPLDQGEDLG